jgi:hypothetical protein
MSHLFGRKTSGTLYRGVNYPRALVIVLYTVSWLFSFSAGILVQTNNNNPVSCAISIISCVVLYASSKVIICLFLMERVYVVTAIGVSRWNSLLYRFNLGILLPPYAVLFFLSLKYRVAEIQEDTGHCMIGVKAILTIPVIVYDTLVCAWLTGLFVRVLMSSTSLLKGPTWLRLRNLAQRTLIGSLISLLLSITNFASLVYFEGYERGLYCLASCTLDVTLNAIVIHWVTASKAGESKSDKEQPHDGGHRGNQQYAMREIGDPLSSHISVPIESYVEDYHRIQMATKHLHQTHDYSYPVD